MAKVRVKIVINQRLKANMKMMIFVSMNRIKNIKRKSTNLMTGIVRK